MSAPSIFPPLSTGHFRKKLDWRKWEPRGICAALVILVFLVFGQTTRHGFVSYDDRIYVLDNVNVTRGLTFAGLHQAFTQREGGLYNPLVTISHMLDCQIFGLNAGGHHLTNVLLHLASVLLLFLVLREMTGAVWRSAFVAALFAIHPLRVESVAWIAERKDVLSGLFFMLTWGAYLLYVRRGGLRIQYAAVVVFFAMGLLCKPMLVTVPFVLLLLDYWPLNRLFASAAGPSGRFPVNSRVILEKLPLLILSLAMCLATMFGPSETVLPRIDTDINSTPFVTRVEEAGVAMVIYLGQVIRPVGLAIVYPEPTEALRWWPAALGLLGTLSWGAFLLRGRYPYLWMGWLWNLGMLVPVSGIVQISRHWRADHYTYLPQIGLMIGLTWTAVAWAGPHRQRRFLLGSLAAVFIVSLALAAYRQTSTWHDNIRLWTNALENTRDNLIAQTSLGVALLQDGQTEEAIPHFREALKLNPHEILAWTSLGMAERKRGRTETAISCFREALRITPLFVPARNNLGMALFQEGRMEEAISCFQEVLRIHPSDLQALFTLGTVFLQQGQIQKAIAQYAEVLRIDPSNAEAHNNLANALIRQGRREEAMEHFREALRVFPDQASAHYNLATLLLQQGKIDEATTHYREALRLNPTDADALRSCGLVLFQQGQPAEAIGHARKALELQPANPDAQNDLAWMLATASQAGLRNGAEAVQLATKADRSSDGNNPHFLRTLAAAHAEAGAFPSAVVAARKALKLAEIKFNPELISRLMIEISHYESGHAYRGDP